MINMWILKQAQRSADMQGFFFFFNLILFLQEAVKKGHTMELQLLDVVM